MAGSVRAALSVAELNLGRKVKDPQKQILRLRVTQNRSPFAQDDNAF